MWLPCLPAMLQKSCDSDLGGCNRQLGLTHYLEAPPRVFTLQLGWESSRVGLDPR